MHKVAKDEKPGINFHILYMLLVFEMILYACSGTERPTNGLSVYLLM